jgi:hypothetical protein
MALVLKDRVKETTTTTGTGTLTLLGAATGYQSFTAIGDGNTCYYAIATTGSAQWEVGIGTYTASGTTLSRDTILDSSTGGGAIDLAAGTKEVFVTYPSEKAVFEDASGDVVQNQFTSMNVTGTATINVGTFTTITGAGSGITSINASNISSGTLANDRTTAATANGASTIVARDASGNFTANVITANGSALTALNATAITTGTLDNARTSASSSNGASTIVARDGSGNFTANVITANGSALTALNATAITTGTLDNARTSAASANGASTIVARDGSGNFSANTITANVTGSISGSAASLTNAQNFQISGGVTAANVSFNGTAAVNLNVTAINASVINAGTIPNANTTATASNGASTIVARDTNGSFSANVGTFITLSGAGGAITALNASNINAGTIPNANTTASSSNGASTIVARDGSGNFTANVITANGSALTALNASNITSGVLDVSDGGTGQTSLTANNVILGNGASAVQFVAPGTTGNILTSNGTSWVSQAAGGGFTSGTLMLFQQTSAPTGWTKQTTHDNKALRVVSGSASSGGSVGFTTAFASQAVSGSIAVSGGSVGSYTLATADIPSHSHIQGLGNDGGITGRYGNVTGLSNVRIDYDGSNISGTQAVNTSSTGGGGGHSHSFTTPTAAFTGTAINLAVSYVDLIIASKD